MPALFTPGDWTKNQSPESSKDAASANDLLELLLRDPELGRLYWALSRVDGETRDALRISPGLAALVPSAPALDFFGGHITIRSGRVAVPGGTAAEAGWKDLVGASPEVPGDFVPRLLAKDRGWLAAYFDALSRVNQSRQAYFADPRRLRRFYEALRGENFSPGAAEGVFRLDSNLLLLVTRLPLNTATGQPQIPGNLETWKAILGRSLKNDPKVAQQWRKRAGHWNNADDLVEGLFGFSRLTSQDGPVQLYLTLSEIDRGRSAEQRLTPQTVRLLGDKYAQYGNQYVLFSEFNGLDNAAIVRFLTVAGNIDRIKDRMLRAETIGTLQADIGLWQILARQGEIPKTALSDSWQRAVMPFTAITSAGQLFDAGRDSLGETLRSTAVGRPDVSEGEIIALLAGPPQSSAEGQQVRQAITDRIRSVLDDQRLVSLDTLFGLADGLSQNPEGQFSNEALNQQASELRAFEMPRPLFTNRERAAWASRVFYNQHAELEMQTNLSKAIQSRTPDEVTRAHGQLAPFLRDTLVGLNYAYYEFPGAQLLHNSPLLVRFHDFSQDSDGVGDAAVADTGIARPRRYAQRRCASLRFTCQSAVCAGGSGGGDVCSGKCAIADLGGRGAGSGG